MDAPDRTYTLDELMAVARQLVTDHHDVIESAGPARDLSGVGVRPYSDLPISPEALTASLSEEVGVPVQFERFAERSTWGMCL